MKNYDEIEEEAIEKTEKKKKKMKVSGKSVFLLQKQSIKKDKKDSH
jgi:hypothetical protein